MMEYKLIWEDDAGSFEKAVTDALADGWELQGSMIFTRHEYTDRKGYECYGFDFMQAMTKAKPINVPFVEIHHKQKN